MPAGSVVRCSGSSQPKFSVFMMGYTVCIASGCRQQYPALREATAPCPRRALVPAPWHHVHPPSLLHVPADDYAGFVL